MKKLAKTLLVSMLSLTMVITMIPFTAVDALASTETGDSPVANIIFDESEIIEGTCGYITSSEDENGESYTYFRYDSYEICPAYTVIMKDGSEISCEGGYEGFEYDGDYYRLSISTDQEYDNQWGVGTHTATAELLGYETTFEVTITESPVRSIEVGTVDYIVNSNGWIEGYTNDNGEYVEFYYYEPSRDFPDFVLTMKDGTVIEGSNSNFKYNDEYVEFRFENDQAENPWGLGTHTVKANILGYSFTYEINIIESPVQSVEVYGKDIVQGSCGETESFEDEDGVEHSYFRYYADNSFKEAVITLKDGNEINTDSSWFEYDGKEYHFDFKTDQSYSNPWGNGVHTVQYNVMGYSGSYDFEIIETAISSIEFEPLEIAEESNGYRVKDYTDNGDIVEWFCYDFENICPPFTVTFENGDVEEFYDTGIWYMGEYYPMEVETDQAYDNQWGRGKHEVDFTLMGYKGSFDVEIVESPVESVTFNKVKIPENTHGFIVYDYIEDVEFFAYEDNELIPTYTITMKNGDKVRGDKDGFYYDGKWNYVTASSDQASDNLWGVGTHSLTVNVMGYEGDVEVEIVENEVESIEFKDLQIVEGTSGYYNDDSKFYYEYEPEFTVKMKDGTVLENQKGKFKYQGVTYRFWCNDGQYEECWDVGLHEAQVYCDEEVIGDGSFEVEIVETDITSVEVLNVQELTENIDGEYNYYSGKFEYVYPEVSARITKADGTSYIKCFDLASSVEGRDFHCLYDYIVVGDPENWAVGGNDFTIYYAGQAIPVTVNIVPHSEFAYIEQDGAAYITGYNGKEKAPEVPSTINGLTVKGILALDTYTIFGSAIEELIVPDSVEKISDLDENEILTTVQLGSGVKNLTADTFRECLALEEITVAENNPNYCSVDGIVYDKQLTTVIAFPPAKTGNIVIPATVTNIDVLSDYLTDDVTVVFAENSGFITVDGVTYTSDMTKVIFCSKEKAGEYIMPDTVTDIMSGAFRGCDKLTNVVISNNVTAITYEDFANCTSLSNITMPDTITTIDAAAFIRCDALETVVLPENLESIEAKAFQYSGLTSVDITDNVTAIYSRAFEKTPLENVTIGDSLQFIGARAFAGTSIQEIVLPESMAYIENSAFSSCDLRSVVIPDAVYYLGEDVFSGNKNLEEATIGKGIDMIPDGAFNGCSALSKVTLRGNVVSVGIGAFSNTALKDINLENISGYIGSYAFNGTKLTDLPLAEGVTDLAYGAFLNCSNLETISIPDSIETMDGHVFDDTAWYDKQADGQTYLDGGVLYDNKGMLKAETEIIVKEGTSFIAGVAFEDESGLKAITLPEGLKGIGFGAFINCRNLAEIALPGSVEYIGEYAFMRCVSLEEITVDPDNKFFVSVDGVLYSKDMTELVYCPAQKTGTLTVPGTVQTIKEGALDSNSLDAIVIPNSATVFEATEYNDNYPLMHVESAYGNIVIHCVQNSKAHEFARANCLKVEFIEGCAHTWDAGVITKESTCSVPGEIVFTCTLGCGVTRVEALKLADHTPVTDAAKAPTCEDTGLTEGSHCSECGEIITAQTEVPALGHTEVIDKGTAATCKAEGLTEGKHCSTCSEVLVPQVPVPRLPHTPETIVGKAATCTEPGLTDGEKCSVCGEVSGKQEVIPALGHEAVIDAAVEPTCTATGLTEGSHCSRCSVVLKAQEEVPALGHTEVIDAAESPTCTATGLTEGKHCSACNEVLVPQEEVPAAGHMETVIPAEPPTCTESGLTEGIKCSVCGETLTAQEEVPATGHVNLTAVDKVDATYFAPGFEAHWACECGKLFADENGSNEIADPSVLVISQLVPVDKENSALDVPTDVMEEIINDAIVEEQENVSVDASGAEDYVAQVGIPSDTVALIVEAGKGLTVATAEGVITIDEAGLDVTVSNAGKDTVITVEMKAQEEEELNTEQQEAVKDKNVEKIIKVSLTADGEEIANEDAGGFGVGSATVEIPFPLGEGENAKNYKLVYISDSGVIEEIEAKYVDGAFIAKLKHLSEYAIIKESAPVIADGIIRLAGNNRYGTCAAISNGFMKENNAKAIVIVDGQNFADALAATPLATELGAPILMAYGPTGALSAEVIAEINRIDSDHNADIYIIGGTGAVNPKAETTLKGMGYANITRLAGNNRYLTAIEVAKARSGEKTAFIASGLDFPDALGGGSAAALNDGVILFTLPGQLQTDTKAFLASQDFDRVVILGGEGPVSKTVENELKGMGFDVDRIYGANRHATSVAVAREFFPTTDTVVIATGYNFADALAGGPLASEFEAPILLLNPYVSSVNPEIKQYIKDSGAKNVVVLGGIGAVSESLYNDLAKMVK